ncbi:MAG: hypothetical protein F4X57_13925 [Chloroflexi bacterium]|nr:hypothetical protein [Chloroflexota bacterium]
MNTQFNNSANLSVELSASELDTNLLFEDFNDDPSFKAELQAATVLLIPSDLKPEYEGPVFPASTREIFRILSEELKGRAVVNSPIKDEDYVEFEYRSEDILLPVLFIGKLILLPLVISVLGTFLHDRLKKPNIEKSDNTVKSEIHFVHSNGTQLHFKYDGPADTFERTAMEHFENLGLTVSGGESTSCKKRN